MSGISSSFNIGVSGLAGIGQEIGVISDNIANSATYGFKASRGEFNDVFATSLRGLDGGNQIGAGTRLSTVRQIMKQGSMSRTDVITDLAIYGDGFFKVKANFGDGFTRDGSMHFSKDSVLVHSSDYPVMGFLANDDGDITNEEGIIKLGSTTIPAKSTEKVLLNMNLDFRANIKQFDPKDPNTTSNFNHSLTIYDNVGTPRLVNIYYNKAANNNWTYRVMVDKADAAEGVSAEDGADVVEMASGTLIFNDIGNLQQELETTNSFNFNKGAAPEQKIKFDWGESISEGGTGFLATTQYGSNSTIARHSQDGYSAAGLASLSFDD